MGSDMKLIPLTRIWCLFELYHCLITTQSNLTDEFTSEGLEESGDAGMFEASRNIEQQIANLDAATAQATKIEDKERILKEIEEKVPGGIEEFNDQLRAALRKEWRKTIREQWGWRMMRTLERSVSKVASMEKEIVSLKGTIAKMMERIERL